MTAMKQYALMPTERGEQLPYRTPSDMDYFILIELEGSGMEDDETHAAPVVIAMSRTASCDAESVHACAHAEPYRHAAPAELMGADAIHVCG